LLILRRAQKQLATLNKPKFERVRDAIALLADNPRPVSCKKLVGRDG
jgi:mRNA interferase RelE/StbE